jgi:hypothetical protein
MDRNQKIIIAIILIYITITFTEWTVHKYIMHDINLDPGHIRHHKSVHIDMKLEPNEFLEKDIKMGYDHSLFITVFSFFMFNLIINKLLKLNVKKIHIFIGSFFLSVFYHLIWNKYHRKMHFEADFFAKTNNKYLKWMFVNHTIHHLQKGDRKGNYNIVFPGADWIMGDYRTEVDNSIYCEDEQNKINSKDICDYALKFKTIPT